MKCPTLFQNVDLKSVTSLYGEDGLLLIKADVMKPDATPSREIKIEMTEGKDKENTDKTE